MRKRLFQLIAVFALGLEPAAVRAFEGRIRATVTQGGQPSGLVYTVGTNQLRLENTGTNRTHARNIVNLETGELTLLFPHNRSFKRVKPASERTAGPGVPGAPVSRPPGIGPQPNGAAGMSALPGMGTMPMMSDEKVELKATGKKKKLLGFACVRYEVKLRRQIMEIWATDQLFPFQPYRQSRSLHFGPRSLEEQWPELLKARKLFPLLVTLRYESGPEHYRFEVKSIEREKITDPDGKLFQPPPDYHELQPSSF